MLNFKASFCDFFRINSSSLPNKSGLANLTKKPNLSSVKTIKKIVIPTLLFWQFCIAITPSISFALDEQQIQQQDWLIRNQQNILEEKRRNLEFNNIEKERELQKKREKEATKPSAASKGDICYPITKIEFDGANSLSNWRKQRLTKPFLWECLDGQKVAEIVGKVASYYRDNGMTTVQVLVPKQNLREGSLLLQVIEGRIEKLSLGKEDWRDKMQKFGAFGSLEGKVLNIDDINQGVSQLNHLQSNQAIIKLEPGSKIGESKVIVENQRKFPAYFSTTHDNLGSKFSGIYKTGFSGSFDNLLSFNDNLNLNYSTNLVDDSKQKENKAFSASLAIPFRYNNFTFDYSRNDYAVRVPIANQKLNGLSGYSDQRKFTFDRTLLSSAKLRVSSFVSLTKKNAGIYQNFVKYAISDRSLTIANFGLATSFFGQNSSFYLRPSFAKGLKILNAEKDLHNMPAVDPKAQFEVFKFYSSASAKLTIPKINLPLTLTSEFDSQIARQSLFGSEKFSIGGYYSVRGFRENYLSGEHGYSLRNKANFNLRNLISPLLKPLPKNENSPIIASLDKIAIEPFFDYGYVQNKFNNQGGRLAGTGLRLIFNSRYFTASLTQSWAAHKSKLINSPEKENALLFFEMNARCC